MREEFREGNRECFTMKLHNNMHTTSNNIYKLGPDKYLITSNIRSYFSYVLLPAVCTICFVNGLHFRN